MCNIFSVIKILNSLKNKQKNIAQGFKVLYSNSSVKRNTVLYIISSFHTPLFFEAPNVKLCQILFINKSKKDIG